MSCLDSLIGLDGRCESTTGTLYLGDVGITEERITNVLREGDTVNGILDKVRRHASACVASDVLGHLGQRIVPHTFLPAKRFGEANDAQEVLTADANTIGGIVVEMDLTRSNVKALFSRASFWGQTTGTIAVTVYDLDDGSTAGTFNLTATSGVISAQDIEFTAQALRQRRRLFFTTTEATYYKVDTYAGCTNCHEDNFRQSGAYVYGARISTAVAKKYSNLQKVSHTSGLGLTISVACDHAAYVCENKAMLALPLLYKQAEEILRYGLMNRERFTADQIKDVAADCEFYSTKYEAELDKAYKHMPLPKDSVCYDCRSRARQVISIP